MHESLFSVLRYSFSLSQPDDLAQPLIHINCKGRVEIENCSSILEYNSGRIRFLLEGYSVLLEGDDLTIHSLNAHVTEVCGRLFRISFSGEER